MHKGHSLRQVSSPIILHGIFETVSLTKARAQQFKKTVWPVSSRDARVFISLKLGLQWCTAPPNFCTDVLGAGPYPRVASTHCDWPASLILKIYSFISIISDSGLESFPLCQAPALPAH